MHTHNDFAFKCAKMLNKCTPGMDFAGRAGPRAYYALIRIYMHESLYGMLLHILYISAHIAYLCMFCICCIFYFILRIAHL